ncbi:MAG: hypothetical protein R2883_03785 [Caldisericia bacterium]
MKKLIIVLSFGLLLLSFIPANAGNGVLTYGVIVEPVPRIGPVTVETLDGYLVSAKLQPHKTSDDLYLGAQVTMRWDGTGLYILHDSIQPIETLERRTWIGEITSYNPELFSFFMTSPAGDVRVFVPRNVNKVSDFACSSIVKVTGFKNAWLDYFTAEKIDVITR